MRHFISPLIFFVLCAAALPTMARVGSRDKIKCTAKELIRQDCQLKVGTYNIRILAKTIAWNDGTWHTVDEMPLQGEASAWEKIQFQFVGGWPILQMWLWDKGFSTSEVQSLHWYVADAEKRKLTMLADGVVRKRRLDSSAPKTKYIFDNWEPHTLKSIGNGTLEWRLRSLKKTISKATEEDHDSPNNENEHRSESGQDVQKKETDHHGI